MKRYLIAGVIIVGLLVFLLQWQGHQGTSPNRPDSGAAAPAPTGSGSHRDASKPASESTDGHVELAPAVAKEVEDEKSRLQSPEAARAYSEAQNVPVAFYGLVVDQDSNALQNVKLDLEVREQYLDPLPEGGQKATRLQRQTGMDGRFEVTGLKGHSVTVERLTKEGYEPELVQKDYGVYGPQSSSFTDPIVFRMWSTNIHELLTTGERSFVIVPDGRRYAIDLINGTISEGQQGDLVAWIRRPESVTWGQRYDWSCEVTTPGGGLLEDSKDPAMCRAPETGYTNVFTHEEEAGARGWGFLTGEKRFYVRLRGGQAYGRISLDLYADYHGKQPAMIHLRYVINPSGSRLLR